MLCFVPYIRKNSIEFQVVPMLMKFGKKIKVIYEGTNQIKKFKINRYTRQYKFF